MDQFIIKTIINIQGVIEMQVIITDLASKWFQQKFNLTSGDGIKFYGKTIQPHNVKHGPKQGYKPESTIDEATIVITKDGINYHVNFADAWFFSGLVVTVDYQQETEEPVFIFRREDNGEADVDAATGASRKYEEYWE